MRTSRLALAGTAILALLGGLIGSVFAQEEDAEPAFPTGTFVAEADGLTLEFRADGTCQRAGVACTYVVRGDAYTETTFEDPSGPQVPATYIWDYDGEGLILRSWGEDPRTGRRDAYASHTFRPVGETLPLPATRTDFPTGTFVSMENPEKALELHQDGSGRSFRPGRSEARFTYGVTGDLYSEMTSSVLTGDPRVPATYHWHWDGAQLTFEVWGEDLMSTRRFTYAENTWVLVEDPRVVVVALSDIGAGEKVFGRLAKLGVVPAAEVGADAFTDPDDVAGNIAMVDIAKGQPITPDMLEPAE
jgi:hypothetical protein